MIAAGKRTAPQVVVTVAAGVFLHSSFLESQTDAKSLGFLTRRIVKNCDPHRPLPSHKFHVLNVSRRRVQGRSPPTYKTEEVEMTS